MMRWLIATVSILATISAVTTRCCADSPKAVDERLVVIKTLESLGTFLKRDKDGRVTFAGIHNPKFGDAHMAGLAKLRRIRTLYLTYRVIGGGEASVTDAGLKQLRRLPHLRLLVLNSRVTDAGVAHLRKCTGLRHLSVWCPHVTDRAIVHLKKMTHLRYLDLAFTKITRDGEQELRRALPNCVIKRSSVNK